MQQATEARPVRARRDAAAMMLVVLPSALLLLPPMLAMLLGRYSDGQLWTGAATVLAIAVALPIPLMLDIGPRLPRGWIFAGVSIMVLLLASDALWLAAVGYADKDVPSGIILGRAILLLSLPAVVRASEVRIQKLREVWALALLLAPAAALTAVVELAPRGLMTALDHSWSGDAAVLRLLSLGGLLAGASLVAVQIRLARRELAWIVPLVPIAAATVGILIAVGDRPLAFAAEVATVASVVLIALLGPLLLVLRPRSGVQSVLFMAWRDIWHPDGAGSETFVDEISRRLAAEGYDVTVFSARYPGAARFEVVDGVRFIRRGGRFTVYLWGIGYHLLGLLPRHDVVVDVQNGIPFFTPLCCPRRVLVVVHHVCREQWDLAFRAPLARLGWWMESRLAPSLYGAAQYVAVSEATKSELADLGVDRDRVSLVQSGTPKLPDPGPVAKTSEPSISFLGRLVPHKRVELLFEALVRLRDHYPGLILTVIGQGWCEQRFREAAVNRGVQDQVRFTGWVEGETKARLLAESWILGMPSAREGWGLAVVEAGTMGTPAVAFRAGGLMESIRDGETGLLADDMEGFVRNIDLLLGNPDLRREMGERARQRASTFTWDEAATQFRDVLDRMLPQAAALFDRTA